MRFIGAAWLLFTLSACGQIQIHDQPWWGSLGADKNGKEAGAAEFHTLATDSAVLPWSEVLRRWNDPANPVICSYLSSFSDIQANYQKLCSDYPSECSIDAVQQAKHFFAMTAWIKKHRSHHAARTDFSEADEIVILPRDEAEAISLP